MEQIIKDLLVVKDKAVAALKEVKDQETILNEELAKLNQNQDVDEKRLIETTKKYKDTSHQFNLVSNDKKALEDQLCKLLKIDARDVHIITLIYKYLNFKLPVVSEKTE